MNLDDVRKAGYKPHDPDNYGGWGEEYTKWIERLVWDDNYDLVPVGQKSQKEDEFLIGAANQKWSPVSPGVTILACFTLYRRWKPGLIKVKVKEE